MNLKLNLKNILCFCCLFLSFTLQAQPSLQLDWEDKTPIARARFIEHDSQNDIITVGSEGTNVFGYYVNLFIEKHDTSGNLLWIHSYSDSLGASILPKDVFIDSFDNIYVLGTASYTNQTEQGFLVKLNSQGNSQWYRYYGSNLDLTGEFKKMAVYNDQYIYVAAEMDSLSGNGVRKSTLLKYDSNGNLMWATSDSAAFYKAGFFAEVDRAGNAYLIGTTTCCLPGGDVFIEKYDSLGNKIWETVVQDSIYLYSYPYASAIDDSANLYIGATIQGFATGFHCGTIKLDSSGLVNWFTPFFADSNSSVSNIPIGIFKDKSDNIYTYGIAAGNGFNRGFITKYNNSGNQLWQILGKDTIGGFWYVTVNALMSNDSTIIIGAFGVYQSNGQYAIVVSIDTSGLLNWQAGTPFKAELYDFDFVNNAAFFTGFSRDSLLIAPDSLFTAKFSYNNGLLVPEREASKSLLMYPNPVESELMLLSNQPLDPISKIKIINSYGSVVKTISYSSNNTKLNVSSLCSGVYCIEVICLKKSYYSKFVKL